MKKKLCHNCDGKPVLGGKTDFLDDLRPLILRTLLKTKEGLNFPAYRLARYLFT